MAKIDRLKKRQEKKYTDRRQIRVQKHEMKGAGKTKQEVRSVKLQTKAASTLGTAKKLGAQDTSVGVNKMARLGQKYNRQIARSGFTMKPGSREVTSPGITRKDDKTNAFSVEAGKGLSSTSKNHDIGGDKYETKAILKRKVMKEQKGPWSTPGVDIKSMDSFNTDDGGFTTMESGKHRVGKSKFLSQNKETGKYSIVKHKKNVVAKSETLSTTSGNATSMSTTTTTKGVTNQTSRNISAKRAARIMKRNPNMTGKASTLSNRRARKLAKKLGGPQFGSAADYYKNN
jgi:hypothetical protein